MSHCHTNCIAIRTGGIFDISSDMALMASEIQKVMLEIPDALPFNLKDDSEALGFCLSKELHGGKGGVVVISGVFNHWHFDQASQFAKALSKHFSTDVMISSLDNEIGIFNSDCFVKGQQWSYADEQIIGRI